MSNSLDQDQAQQNVGPDLDPKCLQRLSADEPGRQRVESFLGKHQIINKGYIIEYKEHRILLHFAKILL